MIYYFVIGFAFILWQVIFLLYFTYCFTFRSPNILQSKDLSIPSDIACLSDGLIIKAIVRERMNTPFEEITISSFDNLKLYGRYYERAKGAPLVIAFHGYRGTSLRDRCCDIIVSEKLGFNLLLVDERSHGKSQGHTITFGVLERYDCLSWAKFAQKRFGKNSSVFLVGVSMGATAVLLSSSLRLPKCIKGIVADSPYLSPKDVICHTCKKMHLYYRIAFPIVRLSSRLFGHFDIGNIRIDNEVKKSNIPILILHGEKDKICPIEMSEKIKKASSSNIRLVRFENAGHGLAYFSNPSLYLNSVEDFALALLEKDTKKRYCS